MSLYLTDVVALHQPGYVPIVSLYLTDVVALHQPGYVPDDQLVGAGGEEPGLRQAQRQPRHGEGDHPAVRTQHDNSIIFSLLSPWSTREHLPQIWSGLM